VIVEKALKETSATKQDIITSVESLRPVMNAFWTVQFSDPHKAITFDEMHANDHGLGGKHFFPQAKLFVSKLGANARQQIDNQMRIFPPWSGLKIEEKVMNVHFSDANKFRDILKMFIFASHNVLTETESPLGYSLLCCLRAYLELTMWEALEVHTEETIASGRAAVKRFGKLVASHSNKLSDADVYENYDFPKFHAQDHGFGDIEQKGVLRNYTTRLFERLHGPLKLWYQRRTDFKNVAPQILQNEHFSLASSIIRSRIDASKAASEEELQPDDKDAMDAPPRSPNTYTFNNVYLGATQKRCSIDDIENTHGGEPAFHQFRSRFEKSLNEILSQDDSPIHIQNAQGLSVTANDLITEHRFLKASYESLVDWQAHTDLLRCNPVFWGKERFDCVFLNTGSQPSFARLLFVFTYQVKASKDVIIPSGQTQVLIPMALVQPFTEIKKLRKKDKDLCLYRLQEKPLEKAIFVPARSIIRGAYIVPEGLTEKNFLVVDLVDTDMFLHVNMMYCRS